MDNVLMIQEIIKGINDTYQSLADEESKNIFMDRIMYSCTGDLNHIDQIVRRYVPEFQKRGIYEPRYFESFLKEISMRVLGKNIIIYGASWNGRKLFEGLKDSRIIAFCDRKAQAGSYDYCGIPVISVDDLVKYHEGDMVVIGTDGYQDEIYRTLKEHGVQEEYIIYPPKTSWFEGCSFRQYFDTDIMKPEPNEVFFDCGCYDCSSIFQFKEWCGNHDKMVYAFEPNIKNYDICKMIIKEEFMDNVRLFNNGLWSEKKELSFSSFEIDVSSHIGDDGAERIQGIAIDDIIEDVPTFIKMDIEGAELEALKGARDTIMRYHPKLAVCVYHNPEDIITIPAYVKSLYEDYQIYIRHYGNWICDTVLYAVPPQK